MTARAAHPALPLTRRRAARALRGGRGGEGHPGARPAPDPALARPPPRPARTHAGKPRMRALGRGGRAALAPPPAAANPGARTAPLPASPRPGGPARGPADVSERSAVQGAQSRWRTRRATLSRSPARAVARALAGWLSLHFFPPSLPASLPLSPPTRAPGCSRLPRALPLSPVGSTVRCELWERATPPPARDLPPGPAPCPALPCARGSVKAPRTHRRRRTRDALALAAPLTHSLRTPPSAGSGCGSCLDYYFIYFGSCTSLSACSLRLLGPRAPLPSAPKPHTPAALASTPPEPR